jgi:hypothetical protein
MDIDRSNYEIWIIDWLDGLLTNQQAERLRSFLDQNPDLKEEVNELTSASLKPAGELFRNKDALKRAPSDILPSQFDYLCAAYFENDLSSAQAEELLEIVGTDPGRKRVFDLMAKTRLAAGSAGFMHKNRLLKWTPLQKTIRLSVIGLSAAAAAVLIIISLPPPQQVSPLKTASPVQGPLSESVTATDPEPVIADVSGNSDLPVKKAMRTLVSAGNRTALISGKDIASDSATATPHISAVPPEKVIERVPVYEKIDLHAEIPGKSLVEVSSVSLLPSEEDERSRAGKFISRTFREKLLKEKKPDEGPVKGYEVAEAGVNGLNKLFGWQMKFDRKTDKTGQATSIYFRSKLLTVNAPVKKREPQQ